MNFTIIPAETWKSQLRKIDILFFRSRLNTQQQERNRGSQQLSLFFRFAIRLIVSSGWMARGSSSPGVEIKRALLGKRGADKRQNRVIDRT